MGPTDRVVVLIDMDCFYCQVEEKLNPFLKDKPIAVVQYNAWRGGGIIAVNYPARDEGVTRHMRGNEAKKKCPSINLVQVPEVRGKADLTKYRDAGKEVADVLATFTPLLQRASVDEAYLDITELVEKKIATDLNDLNIDNLANTFVVGSDLQDFLHNVKTNSEFSAANLKLAVGGLITEEIRLAVFNKTGYRCSAGVAHNKILAKLVCSLHKPNKQTILPQDTVAKFFETVQINKIKSLGGKFGQTLSDDFQINFMSQLAAIPEKSLMQKYDEKTASWLYNVARGVDLEPVTTKLVSKSIACCKNFSGNTALTTAEDVEHWLLKLSEEMSERLEKDLKENNRKAKQMVVSFSQDVNKKDVSSSRTHPLVSYDPKKICRAAFEVVKKFCLRSNGSFHVKFLGLSAGNFEDVKKVREITTFFKVGQNTIEKKSNIDKSHEVQCTIREENRDEITEQNVYCQLTQELDENPEELVFYDDSCRVKADDYSLLEHLNGKLEESESNDISNDVEKPDSVKPASSFFTKYFDEAPVKEITTSDETPSEVAVEETDDTIDIDEPTEICEECNQIVPISDLISHQDHHFALKLSRSERIPQKVVNTEKKKGRTKGVKRKSDSSSNSTLMIFFKKDEEEDSTVATEICLECNKKIRVEEISSHMDYHTAKRIHLEINSIKSSVNPTKLPKVQGGKNKKQTTHRSVISFFRPT